MLIAKRVEVPASRLLHDLCALSRNLYNAANWYVRQDFFNIDNRLFYGDLYSMLRHHKDYMALQRLAGAHAPQQVLRQVENSWISFFAAMKAWHVDPSRFRDRPRPPRYKRRGTGNVVAFTSQQSRVRGGVVRLPEKLMARGFPALPVEIPAGDLAGVRVVPHGDRYMVEILHEVAQQETGVDPRRSAGVDIGLTNTATTSGGLVVKGGAIKSVNQFYNKRLAKLKSLATRVNGSHETRQIKALARKRNDRVNDLIHKTSRRVIDACNATRTGTLYVGYNPGWKDGINLGHRTNQNFVQVPLLALVQQLEYKGALAGIVVHRVTEEYTSQTCSRCGARRAANRVHRGLYTCHHCGLVINADVNAARNIQQKGIRETSLVVGAAMPVADRGGLNPPPRITIAP
jgi:putative transposase